ncbi:MAG: glycosyl transferase family 2, partial [Acidobacteria bacterium]|nr:glycosyl transferase family 2 [Acidobacteriota bacterium]
LPARIKAEAVFHLTSNVAYLLMVAASLLYFPVMRIRERMEWHQLMTLDLPILLFGSGSVLAFYLLSQKDLRSRWGATLWDLPCLMSVGMGLCVNNSLAVLEALWGRRTDFVRTPKLSVQGNKPPSTRAGYRGRLSPLVLLEFVAALYFVFVLAYAMRKGIYVSLPFVLLFLSGYLYSSVRSLGEALLGRR